MSEVSCRALVLFFDALEREDIPVERLVEVTNWPLDDLLDLHRRIPWDDFSVLCDRMRELLGSDEALVRMGRGFLEIPVYWRIGRLLSLAVTPSQLYSLNLRLIGGWMFHAPEWSIESATERELEVAVRLPAPYRPSVPWMQICQGALAAWPLLVGMPHADVTVAVTSPREAVYRISVAGSWRKVGLRLRQRLLLLGGVFRPDALVETLIEREQETREIVRTLDAERRALRQSRETLDVKVAELEAAAEERLELERRLLHAQKLESLGVIASGIAHDFNNLLTGIQANVELLLADDGSPDEDSRRRLRRIARAASRASDLTNRILAYSGRAPNVVRPFDLSGLVADLGDLLEAALPKTVRIETDLGEGLPAVEGDPAQVQQVAMNLITNAAEAVDGDGAVHVTTRGARIRDPDSVNNVLAEPIRPGAYAVLEVADAGGGLDPAVRGRMFDPFFSTKGQGRGLGLSTVIGVVRGHGGALEVDSPPGGGTVFRAWFPASEVEPAHPVAAPAPVTPTPGGTVLVVDDEELVRQTAADLLEAHGFRSLTAADGQEALGILAAHPTAVDVVLLDWSMPGLSGAEVFGALRRRWPEIPVVVCSAYDLYEDLDALWSDGLAAFVRKPWRGRELSAVLRAHCRAP